MRKVNESYITSHFNTRLKHKCTSKKTKFTACDHEIFADLNKLDSGSKQFVFKKRILNKISMNTPQSSRRKHKKVKETIENTENEVVQALTILMDCSEPDELISIDQENLETSQDQILTPINLTISETKVIENGFCRKSIPSTLNIFSIQLSVNTSESPIPTV